MKSRICLAFSLAILGAIASLASCQRIFSSSPLATVLPDKAALDLSAMTLDQKLEVADWAISSGDSALAATVLASLQADYPGLGADRRPAVMAKQISLALLTTDISGAVAGAIKAQPANGSAPSADQQAAIEASMQRIALASGSPAFVLFTDMATAVHADPAAAAYAGASGSDCVFAGLALIQSITRGKASVNVLTLPADQRDIVINGGYLVQAGRDRLVAAGCPESVIDGLLVFANLGP